MKLKTWTLPSNYIGQSWNRYRVAPVTRHRDSQLIEESNWAAQLKILSKVDSENEDWGRDGGAPWEVVSENHWAVGWVEWVAVHPEAGPWIAALEKLGARLEEYPIADSDDLCEREAECARETWAHGTVKDRVYYLRRAGFTGSVLVARRAELPCDETGRLDEILVQP